MAGLIGQIGVSVTHHVVKDPSYHQEYAITVCLVVKSAPETASACKIVLHIFVKVSYLYISIYPAVTAFTNQYSLLNIFVDIGQL